MGFTVYEIRKIIETGTSANITAEILHCSPLEVRRFCDLFNVDPPGIGEIRRTLDRDDLERDSPTMGVHAMAQKYNTSPTIVTRELIRHGLTARGRGERISK